MNPNQIQAILAEAFSDGKVNVEGDGRHFNATIISPCFANQNTLVRHRRVYAALGELMQEAIHALSIQALTPEEHGE